MKPLVGGMVLVLLAVVSMAVTGSNPAFADDQARQQLPIVAGTELIFTAGECTAGLVLQADGALSNITSYQRAVRYVLTAGHCGNVNDAVGVVTPNGEISVGTVYWKSGGRTWNWSASNPMRSGVRRAGSPPPGRSAPSRSPTPRAPSAGS